MFNDLTLQVCLLGGILHRRRFCAAHPALLGTLRADRRRHTRLTTVTRPGGRI